MQRFEVKLADTSIDETGVFSGYGAVFGNIDSYEDVIDKGAFKKSLGEWRKQKRMPPMLLQHGGWMMTDTDAIPVGKWMEMEEDDYGLKVKGKLINLDTDLGKRVYGAMREGVLDGMSIGYRARKFTNGTKPNEPRRKLHEVDLMELSIVTFPANGEARVSAIKSLADLDTHDFREMEAHLRDEGFSHTNAKKAVAGLKSYLFREGEGEPDKTARDESELTELADMLRRNIKSLS